MALQFIGVTSGSGVSSSSAAISYHGSTTSGDLVVVLLHYRNQSLGFTQATGYTALFDNYLTDSGGGSAWRAYYQFSSSTPDDPSSSFAAATDEYMWLCYTFRDADDIATSSSSHSGTFGDGGFNEDPDPPAISPSVANVIQVPSCAFSGNTTPDTPTVWPSGYDVGTRQFIAESILGLAAVHKSASTSDDPSAFEISDLYEWYARTIVVSKSGGTGGAIEGPDSSGGTGAVESTGSGSPTEDQDESSGTGTTGSTGTGDPTEGPDVGGGDGGIDIVGSGGPTEGADDSSSSGEISIPGSASATEQADTPEASGTSLANTSGTASVVEDSDSSSATGGSAVSGSSAITEDVDSPASSGSLTVSGSSSSTEASDDAISSGLSSVSGSASRTEQSDSTTTSGDSTLPGTGSPTEQSDTSFSSGAMLIAGSLALFEASDPTAAAGVGQFIGGDLDVTESSDPPEASGDVDAGDPGSVTGFTDYTEGEDDKSAFGISGSGKGTKRCCCQGTCLIASDDFNRPDGDPGPKWYGDGVIVDNTLEADNDSTRVCSPRPLGSFHASCKLIGTTNGAIYIVKAGDPNGDYLITATFTGSVGTGAYNIEVDTGAETLNYDFDWDAEDETLVVCYQPGIQLSAGPSPRAVVNSGEAQWVTLCIDNTHDDCWVRGSTNVGNWTFVSGTFDDWVYQIHWIEKQECPNCDCFCSQEGEHSCIPDTLYVTIHSTTCSEINGTYQMNQKVVLGSTLDTYPTLDDWPQKRYWVSEAIHCPDLPEGTHSFLFILECQTGRLNTEYPAFELTAMRYGTDAYQCSNLSFDGTDPDTTEVGNGLPQQTTRAWAKSSSTCSPLSLNFPALCEDNFSCSEPSYACCGGSVVSGDPLTGEGGGVSSPDCFTVSITE